MNRNVWLHQTRRWLSGSCEPKRSGAPARRSFRPFLEQLESRLVPATFNPTDAAGLIVALQAADAAPAGTSSVVNLQAGTTYTLTAVNNFWYGPTGLPPIDSAVVIHGNGATISRDVNAPDFRLFYVSGGMELPAGSLTMDNVTLQGGLAKGGNSDEGGGGLGAGGAVFNQGTLALTDVTLTNNEALGGSSGVPSPDSAVPVNGGGGMGEDAGGFTPDTSQGNGGGFGGSLGGSFGGTGGIGGRAVIGSSGLGLSGAGGGGGGFLAGANGTNAINDSPPGFGGGQGGFGGDSGNGGDGGLGGEGGAANSFGGNAGASGGGFGSGGFGGDPAGGSGGGVGGGGGGVAVNQNTGGGGGTPGPADATGGGGGFGGGGGGGGNNGLGSLGGEGGFGGGAGAGAPRLAGTTTLVGLGSPGGFGGGAAFHVSGGIAGGGGGAGLGGAVFNMGADSAHPGSGQATLINCTLVSNTAQGGGATAGFAGSGIGGALFNLDGRVALTSDTLALNIVRAGDPLGTIADGGAVYSLAFGNDIDTGQPIAAALVLNNSILATSVGGNDLTAQAINGSGANSVTVTGSHNLVMSNGGGVGAGVIVSTANPNLGPLQNNGGLTPTLLPVAGSPVLGVGDASLSPTTDQRGLARPSAGAIDLGAVQVQSTSHRIGHQPGAGGGNSIGTSAGFVGLAIEEFELVLDTLLSEIDAVFGMPHASLDATIAQLQTSINNDPLTPTFNGEVAIFLGKSALQNALAGM